MVRSIEDCISGVDALKEKSTYLTKTNRSESVLDEYYTEPFQDKQFFDYVPESDLQLWIKNNKKTALSSIKEALIEGKDNSINKNYYAASEHEACGIAYAQKRPSRATGKMGSEFNVN